MVEIPELGVSMPAGESAVVAVEPWSAESPRLYRGTLRSAGETVQLAVGFRRVAIVDGVYNDVKDTEGFLAECEQGRQMGFDGKTLIHPGQVEGANAAFAPSEQAVADARGLIAAWEDGKGAGVVTYNGRMVENLHVESARRTLSIHEAIGALSTD